MTPGMIIALFECECDSNLQSERPGRFLCNYIRIALCDTRKQISLDIIRYYTNDHGQIRSFRHYTGRENPVDNLHV